MFRFCSVRRYGVKLVPMTTPARHIALFSAPGKMNGQTACLGGRVEMRTSGRFFTPWAEHVVISWVDSPEGADRVMAQTARVDVLLPGSHAEFFEAYCRTKGHKKSTLIARLIREHLDREHFDLKPSVVEESRRS